MNQDLLCALFQVCLITKELAAVTAQILRVNFKDACAPIFLPVIYSDRQRIGDSPT
jgi:hypothetical protein